MGRIFIQMTHELRASGCSNSCGEGKHALVLKNMNLLRSSFDEQGIRVERLVIAKDTFDRINRIYP